MTYRPKNAVIRCSYAPGRTIINALYSQCREDAVVYNEWAERFCRKHKRYNKCRSFDISEFPANLDARISKYYTSRGSDD